MEGFKLKAICEDCGEVFMVGSDAASNIVEHKKKVIIKGETLFLTSYVCPKCGRLHFVQIDSNYTLDLLRGCKKQFYKLCAMKNDGKKISKKQSDKFKNARQHLAESRNNLMKKYTGAILHDNATGSDIELKFSVV